MSLAFEIEEFPSIDSTNDHCRKRAETGAPEGLVIRADLQTGGKGRRGRKWISPKGNLYCSLLLRPLRPAREAAVLGFAAVVALGDVVGDLLGPERTVGHKWPNDLLIDGKKTAGLLLEAQGTPEGGLAWLVMGIGVNICSHPEDTPYPATDLAEMGSKPLSAQALLKRFLDSFSLVYGTWTRSGFAAIEPAWTRRAVGIGREIEVRLDRSTLAGQFLGLDLNGALVLELPNGQTRRIAAGEVFFPWLLPALTEQ